MFGGPADLRDAQWFAGLWEEFGYTSGVHLRRVHYQVFSTRGRTATGESYENTSKCWDDLNGAAKAARYLGLVDAEAFTDARNDPPRIHVRPRDEEPQPAVTLETDADGDPWGGWWVPSYSTRMFGRLHMPAVGVTGYEYDPADQPALVEVWIEKTTMDDVLIPVCQQLNVNLLSGAGFQSITAVISLLRRAERYGKPAHVLYVADFDPAGDAMPAAVARQAQFWREFLGIDAELTLDPLALTRAQVSEYDLPRAPVKVDKNGARPTSAASGSSRSTARESWSWTPSRRCIPARWPALYGMRYTLTGTRASGATWRKPRPRLTARRTGSGPWRLRPSVMNSTRSAGR
jgi:hypothetical protein